MADIEIAKIVYQVGRRQQVSDKAMLAAFEAGLVESGMRNLDHGDRDSLGVFQQRPSQGWGSPEQIMDPAYAAGRFFEVAKRRDAEFPAISAGQLAQKVQRSAFPERYDQREGEARELLARARQAVDGGGAPPPGTNFNTWGTGVQVRREPNRSAPVVRRLAGPTPVRVECQKRGEVVDAEGFSNDVWSFVPDLGGYISNIYIDHPDARLPGVREC